VKYRFINPDENDWWPPGRGLSGGSRATGNTARDLGSGAIFHAGLPLWMQKDLGKWTTYGGGGYGINPGHWFVGWQHQRQITDKLTLGAELFHRSAFTTGERRFSARQ
jgi:hypothetical protein